MKKPSEIIVERANKYSQFFRITLNEFDCKERAILDYLDEKDRQDKMPPQVEQLP